MTTPTSPGPGGRPRPASLVTVELTREEVSVLLMHVITQRAELDRVLQGLEEEVGESPTKWNLKRSVAPQLEVFNDLTLKLESAAKEAGWR